MDLIDSLLRIEDTVLRTKVAKALSVLSRTLALYPVESIALSFNGGKDSTVLLHLLRAALAGASSGGPDTGGTSREADHGLGGIRTFFFENSKDFQQVIDFVHDLDGKHQLHVDYLSNPGFQAGLIEYLSAHSIKAIVLGTRRGDPNAGDQEYFCPSSEGWPPFMRVNPIIDWTYHDVWAFLKHIGVDWCSLYDQGYTSLGSRFNTAPNRWGGKLPRCLRQQRPAGDPPLTGRLGFSPPQRAAAARRQLRPSAHAGGREAGAGGAADLGGEGGQRRRRRLGRPGAHPLGAHRDSGCHHRGRRDRQRQGGGRQQLVPVQAAARAGLGRAQGGPSRPPNRPATCAAGACRAPRAAPGTASCAAWRHIEIPAPAYAADGLQGELLLPPPGMQASAGAGTGAA
jgi:FAD synthetase